jgi:hypothetical protein
MKMVIFPIIISIIIFILLKLAQYRKLFSWRFVILVILGLQLIFSSIVVIDLLIKKDIAEKQYIEITIKENKEINIIDKNKYINNYIGYGFFGIYTILIYITLFVIFSIISISIDIIIKIKYNKNVQLNSI